jgi:peptidyl-prolyl cis-trans isomerase B (cyclophilin B)
VPSEKRARQRAAREAKFAAQAKVDRRKKLIRNAVVVVIVAVVVVGSIYLITKKSPSTSASSTTTSSSSTTTTSSSTTTTTVPSAAQAKANSVAVAAGCPNDPQARVNTLQWSASPKMTINTADSYQATVKTDLGTFVVALDAKTAPVTVNNFVFLAKAGYYRCVIFHRVIPGFMDQTGDPTGTGTGGPGYTIADEYPAKAANAADQYPVGSVAMANTGAAHTGGSQFFIVTGSEGESLANTYTLFGQVTSGLSVVQAINADGSAAGVPPDVTHRILSVTITET